MAQNIHHGLAGGCAADRAQDRPDARRARRQQALHRRRRRGYNVEWSQELKVHESFDEYLRAWVLIHALHHKLGWPGARPGMIFNMSVGYNLEGIRKPNVQWYLDAMAMPRLPAGRGRRRPRYPAVATWTSPPPVRLDHATRPCTAARRRDSSGSRSTLSRSAASTLVKLQPDLARRRARARHHQPRLGFGDVPIPDEAFAHDLKWADAVPMFTNLKRRSRPRSTFGPEAHEHARGRQLAHRLRPRRAHVPVGPGAPRGDDQPRLEDRRGVPRRPPDVVRRRRRLLQRGRPTRAGCAPSP